MNISKHSFFTHCLGPQQLNVFVSAVVVACYLLGRGLARVQRYVSRCETLTPDYVHQHYVQVALRKVVFFHFT